jgi:hypothetical protein
VVIEVIHLHSALQLIDDISLMGNGLFKAFVFLVFLSLGEHEGAEFLKLALEVGSVLLFLKIAEMGVFHRRY